MKSQKCKYCAYYTAYYKKHIIGFERTNVGHCLKFRKLQTQLETCENFKCGEKKEQRQQERIFVSLEQALKSVNDIGQILKEKYLDS